MTKAEKARQMMYKRPVLDSLNFRDMLDELETIQTECDDASYIMDSDIAALIDALDGEEEQAYEFRTLFADLSAQCEQLQEAIYNNEISGGEFDDMAVSLIGNRYEMIGYDYAEEDWRSLTGYDAGLAATEAGKRIMRHTKAEMLSMIGQVLGTLLSFLDLRQKYDYLEATIEIVKGSNRALLDTVREIEKAYDAATEVKYGFYDDKAVKAFDKLLSTLPDKVWVE